MYRVILPVTKVLFISQYRHCKYQYLSSIAKHLYSVVQINILSMLQEIGLVILKRHLLKLCSDIHLPVWVCFRWHRCTSISEEGYCSSYVFHWYLQVKMLMNFLFSFIQRWNFKVSSLIIVIFHLVRHHFYSYIVIFHIHQTLSFLTRRKWDVITIQV